MKRLLVIVLLLFLASCSTVATEDLNLDDYSVATFAGGCFWCMESAYEEYDGVVEVVSGFSGGEEIDPSYAEVSSGTTGHREAVQVYYDKSLISYDDLLQIFWRQIDPTDLDGSFVDRGFQYSSAIFYHSEEEKTAAEASQVALEEARFYDAPIAAEITAFITFYEAEEYHQDYYETSPVSYTFYRYHSGRDQYREEQWGDDKDWVVTGAYQAPTEDELQEILTDMQYYVTQEDGTEPPYDNEYWDKEEAGIYVDIVSGEALFSSQDKYDSGTGWPSFTKPLAEENIVERTDYRLIYPRTELRSAQGDSHLGHVFNDGPEPGGLRYCVNSAALEFIPLAEMEARGYGEYVWEHQLSL